MSHELTERADGTVEMAYVGSEGTPWRGLGTKLNDEPTIEEAFKAAGLNWEVELVPLVTKDREESAPAKAVRRKDTSDILGVVGMQYHSLQNIEAFDWFTPFLDAGLVSLDTAGSLSGGKKVWVLAKIKRDPIVITPGDEILKYVMISNSHDGTTSVRVGLTPIRIVCQNTLTLAHSNKASKFIRVRHTKNIQNNLEALQEVIDIADKEFIATGEQYKRLMRKSINQADVRKYVREVFEIETPEEKLNGQQQRLFERVAELFETGRGMDISGVRGTMWAAFNSINSYLCYDAGKSQDSRLSSLWFGAYQKDNQRALDVAIQMSA